MHQPGKTQHEEKPRVIHDATCTNGLLKPIELYVFSIFNFHFALCLVLYALSNPAP